MQEQLQSKTAAHTLPSWCTSAVCVLLLYFSPPLLTCLTLQRINRETTVVACLSDFAAYINDDGQGGTAPFVLRNIMLSGSAPKRISNGSRATAIFVPCKLVAGNQEKFDGLTYGYIDTYIHTYYRHHRQPYGSLGGARSDSPQLLCIYNIM